MKNLNDVHLLCSRKSTSWNINVPNVFFPIPCPSCIPLHTMSPLTTVHFKKYPILCNGRWTELFCHTLIWVSYAEFYWNQNLMFGNWNMCPTELLYSFSEPNARLARFKIKLAWQALVFVSCHMKEHSLGTFRNKQDAGENCILNIFLICDLHQILGLCNQESWDGQDR